LETLKTMFLLKTESSLVSLSLILASFEGILRILNPHQGDFSHDDLLLEEKPEPSNGGILQIKLGSFCSGPELTLAILYSRKICVFSYSKNKLTLEYEHVLT